ncbi:GDSL-like Lipase/Acylhydrolase [Limihaloglobus sulfuriphilus]|uniref:GDSL-like Lipase/Acylhydrolase n=1 Tax=Limihaloglobus sulfuriphilus TaxID=1851148 RepID=A0A1Q2MCK3_9BACT|nr:SGNH/GDSL hydrolase family protein [Limihaloglobus sulfuriphilus]AQQ70394.1 GDSL-like Lipase/Acylhydrolase [Limihaloglobus sulfuriphilus]
MAAKISLLFVLCSVLFVSADSAGDCRDIFESEQCWKNTLDKFRPKDGSQLDSPSFRYFKAAPNMPRVLIYGDSISIGYTQYVQDMLAGKAIVQRIPTNGDDTFHGAEYLELCGMEKGRWDVIHFNWGLHDLKRLSKTDDGRVVPDKEKAAPANSIEAYSANLEKLIKLMKSSGAELVFAATTPAGGNAASMLDSDVRAYNEAAFAVMEKHGVRVNNLYSVIKPNLSSYQGGDGVHFKPQGSLALAAEVGWSILSVLDMADCSDIYSSRLCWTRALNAHKIHIDAPAYRYVETRPDLPRVLIYGDSISIGYTKYVQDLLEGKVIVQRIPTNGGATAGGYDKLKYAGLEQGKWDLIHFNWGLHDLKYLYKQPGGRTVLDAERGSQVSSVNEYADNLDKLVEVLKTSGAKLVFASTTPVGPGNAGRKIGDAARYNQAASQVMKKHGVSINDLYGLVKPRLSEYQLPNNVHYNEDGSRAMARQVAECIVKELEIGITKK